MQLNPVIAVHLSAMLGAVAIGPFVIWARRGAIQHPRLHRAFGYAWVTLMLAAALSAMFIRDYVRPNIAGYTVIHLLVPVVLGMLFGAFYMLAKGRIRGHRRFMVGLYVGACMVAGAFTFAPNRVLGQWARNLF